MAKKRKNILIHPNRIEDLDKTRAELRKKAIEPKPTGYSSVCRIRNTRWSRDILFKDDFVSEKMKSMTFMVFHPIGQEKTMMLQPVPPEYINRTSVCHIAARWFARLRRFAFRAPLDRVPEPCEIFRQCGIDPLAYAYTFMLEEWEIMDDAMGKINAYKLIPLSALW